MFSASRSGGRSFLPTLDGSRHRPRSASMGLHSRDSYGVAKRSLSEERKSAGSAVRRWSGIRNSLSNQESRGVIKDTRPLSDKAYQKSKVTEIAEFLELHDYNPLTPAKLMQLTKKEFETIFQFFVNFFEPSFVVKSLEEDAPKMLKYLGYPFIPNKSAFTYVARTNFSSHLGVLIFLMDIAKFTLSIDSSKLFANDEHAVLLSYIVDCHNSNNVSDEEQVDVFEKIIGARNEENLSELQQENDIKKEKLKKVQSELKDLKKLQEDSELLDSQKRQYEEYLLEMAKHTEKKENVISDLLAELNQKKILLAEIEEKLKEKQAVYDAQGFDGKKHLFHYEERKQELNEMLQKRKAELREVQDECWDLELQHSTLFDKGSELNENFNNMYAQIEEAGKTVTSNLQSIEDQSIRSLINNLKLNIPETQLKFNQRALSALNNTYKEALEEIQKKISTSRVILKTIVSSKSEDLVKIEMKKSFLSSKLKCATAVETEKEQEFIKTEKLAVEEVKAFEQRCDEELKALKEIQNKNKQLDEHNSKLESDLKEVEKIRKSKAMMLEKYLEDQNKLFNKFSSNLQATARKAEECGEEIASTLEELIQKYKEI